MTISNMTDYTNQLASKDPSMGGGTAAAISGAQGVALCAMVCNRTIGHPDCKEHQTLAKESEKTLLELAEKFIALTERDAEAYHAITSAHEMQHDNEMAETLRTTAYQLALRNSTKPPFETMLLATESLILVRDLIGKSDPSVANDLGVAALSLKTAIQGAELNVLIHLSRIQDQAFVAEYRKNCQAILAKSLPIADEIYQSVLKSL